MILTSCRTVDTVTIEIPAYSIQTSVRPVLEGIPKDTDGAIKALVTNMNRLITYVNQLEFERDAIKKYVDTIIEITTR